jgi:hypothetical protein
MPTRSYRNVPHRSPERHARMSMFCMRFDLHIPHRVGMNAHPCEVQRFRTFSTAMLIACAAVLIDGSGTGA